MSSFPMVSAFFPGEPWLTKCHRNLIVHRALRSRSPELPLQPVLSVVKFRNFRNQALEIDPHCLPLNLAKLKHDADWGLLPRRLVQPLRRLIVLAEEAECRCYRP